MGTKLHWYHCTSELKGDLFTAEYRAPIYCSKNEPDTPRICVCQYIPNCLSAVLFRRRPVYVYRTVKKLRGIRPRKVWDELITMERWIIPPVDFELFEVISVDEVNACQDAARIFHSETKQNSSIALRIGQLIKCWDVLGERFPDKDMKRFCDFFRKRYNIGPNADDWILGKALEKLQNGKVA